MLKTLVASVLLVLTVGLPLAPALAAATAPPVNRSRAYINLERIAAALKAKIERTRDGLRALLKLPRDESVLVTRNNLLVLINGKAVALSAPVIVAAGEWLVPDDFLGHVLARVSPPRVEAARQPAKPSLKARVPVPPSGEKGRRPKSSVRVAARSASAAAPDRAVARPSAQAAAVPGQTANASRRSPRPPGVSRAINQTAASPAEVATPLKRARAVMVGADATTPPVAPRPRGPRMSGLRVRSYPSFTRVVLEADQPFDYRIERGLTDVKLRLPDLEAVGPRVEEIHDGHVEQVRLRPVDAETELGVSFARAPGPIRLETLPDPFRLVLDVSRIPTPPAPQEIVPALQHIVLDAGHGGHDPGATGPRGLLEKDLVLDVTRRVAQLVQARLGIRVTLSRTGDYFVPLQDRTSFANREGANLFVSIHANAHRDAASAGVETYFLSLEATDIAARQVAERENEVVRLESPASSEKMDALRSMLWDLSQSAYLEESSNLAEVVQDSMTQSLRIPNRGVKQAGFYVLGGAAMPAVLIEIGFVTNPREARRLTDTRYRDEIATAIYAGLAEYKKRYDLRMSAGAFTDRTGR
jgi:N-acetylmuramoyl-L-alanine amidase